MTTREKLDRCPECGMQKWEHQGVYDLHIDRIVGRCPNPFHKGYHVNFKKGDDELVKQRILREKLARELCRWDWARRIYAPWSQQTKTYHNFYFSEADRIIKLLKGGKK